MVNFPTRIPDCSSHSPVHSDLFISSDICSYVLVSPNLGNSDHIVAVSIDFSSNSKQDALFHHTAYDYPRADWDGLRNHLRDVA